MTALLPPLNLKAWIDEHRHLLKPPVGNKVVWEDRDFIVMVVGGPNHRKDFHVNPTEELFFQVEGDIVVRIIDAHGQPQEVPIREGEMFLLPANIPHSPQRSAGTVGMVVERRRPRGEDDHIRFYCDKCGEVVHDEQFELADIQHQLKRLMEDFWSDATMRTCMQCGGVLQPPTGQVSPPPKDMPAPTVRVAETGKSAFAAAPVRPGQPRTKIAAHSKPAATARGARTGSKRKVLSRSR
jgi:3-hydroxyanthranilate 3,4-dioxygenase